MEPKPHSQKDRQNENAEGYVTDEGKDTTSEEQLNELEIGNLPEKTIQNNDSGDDPGPQKMNGVKDREDARSV